MWNTRSFFLISTLVLVASAASAESSIQELHYLVGHWEADVSFFDASGEPERRGRSETTASLLFDGDAIEQTGELSDPPMSGRSLYYVDRQSGEVRWAALSSTGTLYHFRGGLEDGVLTLTTDPVPRGNGAVRFRRVDRDIRAESYKMAMYVSSDDGATWRMLNRQVNRRIEPASRRDALLSLASYAGDWLAERRTNEKGEAFRFRYRLEPYDEERSIYEMTITQEFEDGRSSLLWKGFKGWNPVEARTYYRGFSPSGRVGTGTLVVNGDELETVYLGFGTDGQAVRIRDVFTLLGPDRFRNTTYLYRDGAWKKVNEDNWQRKARE